MLGGSGILSHPAAARAQPAGGDHSSDPAARLVTLGGSVTEIVFALGAGARVAGVDASSVWPPEVEALPNVGYFRTLGAEGVLSLEPDLVVAGEGAGPPEVLEQLRAAGVEVVIIPDGASPPGAVEKIRRVAAVLGAEAQGEALAAQLEDDLTAAAHLRARIAGKPPRALFLWGQGGRTLLAGGLDTGADAMIRLAGAENAAADVTGYKPLTPEAVVAAAPDVVIVPRRTLDGVGGADAVWQTPGLAGTPAARNQRLVVVDTLEFLGFGPRTGKALLELLVALHPELSVTGG